MLLESLREEYSNLNNVVIIEDVTGLNETYLDAEISWNKIIMEQVSVEFGTNDEDIINESFGEFIDKVIEWFKKIITKILIFIRDIFNKLIDKLNGVDKKIKKSQEKVKKGFLKDKDVKISFQLTPNMDSISNNISEMFNVIKSLKNETNEAEVNKKDNKLKELLKFITEGLSKKENKEVNESEAKSIVNKPVTEIGKIAKYKENFNQAVTVAKAGIAIASVLKGKSKKDEKDNEDLNKVKLKQKIVSLNSNYATKITNFSTKIVKLKADTYGKIASRFEFGSSEKEENTEDED